MPPLLALAIWALVLIALLRFDAARESKMSAALWMPVLWIFILATRLPSQWLDSGGVGQSAQASEDGNGLDRAVDLAFILFGAAVLVARSFRWQSFFKRNLALTAYLGFALLSVLWSDYSFVALKRWVRDSGDVLMVLIVLSDPRPADAVRAMYRRLNYLLIPLSVLLVKYFPAIGKTYTSWSGESMWIGPTTGKNLLGLVGMLSALFFLWDFFARWPERKRRIVKRVIFVDVGLLAMSLWVLQLAHSTTCIVCCVLGSVVIAVAHTRTSQRHPTLLKVLVPSSFVLYAILAFGFNMNGELAGAVGKDPSLTDRTVIWRFVLGMHSNPLLGTGYESFWMGERLQTFWRESGEGRINEAHNGFLEVYLNLGLIGVVLIVGIILASFRRICEKLNSHAKEASLDLAFWLITLFFSVTEAGFRSGLMWVVFLLGATVAPARAKNRARDAQRVDQRMPTDVLSSSLLPDVPARNATWSRR